MEKAGLLAKWENPGVAIVTGASSGIGAEFARQLAARGFTPVLVARREDRLKAIAEELQQTSGVAAEVIVADLAMTEGIERVETRMKELNNLDVLVNNAGFGTVGDFSELDFNLELAMLTLHIVAPVHFCRAALERMIPRKRGAIINVSSIAALAFAPKGVMYNSTKVFLKAFSENLALNFQGKKIKVQALCPGFTRTEFGETESMTRDGPPYANIPENLWMTTTECVSLSLANLGKGAVAFVPGEETRAFLARLGVKLD